MKLIIAGTAKKAFEELEAILFGMGVQEITRAFCLDHALEDFAHYDGVVCSQSMPTHLSRVEEPEETQSGNWAAVSNKCHESQIPFVLLAEAGNYRLAERFNKVAKKTIGEWPAFALVEPVDAADVASTILTATKWAPFRKEAMLESVKSA